MMELSPVLKAELQSVAALDAFSIREDTDTQTSKRPPRAIEIAFEGVRVDASVETGAKLGVAWGVHIIVPRSPTAAEELGAALTAVIGCLLGFKPPKTGGRVWSKLTLTPGGTAVQKPEFVDQGLAEYAVIFETSAVYHGRQ